MGSKVHSRVKALGVIVVIAFGVAGCGGSSDAKSVCMQHATTGPDIALSNFDSYAADFFDWVDGVKTTDDELNELLGAEVSAGREMLQRGGMSSYNAWAATAIAVEVKCQQLLSR